jgi:hypothetical protein
MLDMYRNHFFLSLALSLVLLACQDDAVLSINDEMIDSSIEDENEDNLADLPNVEAGLRIYFNRFQAEAAERGQNVYLNDLIGLIQSIPEDNVAGQCTYHYNRPNVVLVDADIWGRLSDSYREFIVFHELGHCVLGRGHDESTNAQGVCLSIMRSGLGDCRDVYSFSTRDYYLDELFYND